MWSTIALVLLNLVLASAQNNMESMLQGSLKKGAQNAGNVIPSLGGTSNIIPSLGGTSSAQRTAIGAQTASPQVAATPAPKTAGNSVISGLLGGSQQSAGAGGPSPSPSSSGLFNNGGMSPSPSSHGNNFGLSSEGSSGSGLQQPKVQVSRESKLIVQGIVEAFMHKQVLLPGEKTCLENSVSQVTGDIVGTGKDVIVGVKAMLNKGHGQQSAPSVASQGSMASAGIDGAIKLFQLVTLSTTLIKNCVQGDAVKLLEETAHHLINMTYLESRIIVSGVDILSYLADSITAFENRNYEKFGNDIGAALRKVLLSNSTKSRALPEGVPEQDIIRKTIEGLMQGMFVRGETLEIEDRKYSDVDIKLDLHRCIAGNEPFFNGIFSGIWSAIATLSVNADQHSLGANQTLGQPKWTGELMVAMLQLPAALQRCDIDMENQQMMMEAIQSLGQLKVRFHLPQSKASMRQVSARMARGVKAWTNWHFTEFGREIGYMFRELLLMAYPKKYSIDAHGRLRRQLESFAFRKGEKGASVVAIGGVVFAVLVGFLAVRTGRSFRGASNQDDADQVYDDAEGIE